MCSLDWVILLFGDRQIGWLRRTFDLWCVLAGSSSISAMGMTHQKRKRSPSVDNPSESAMEANAEVCLTENRNLLSLPLFLSFPTLFSFCWISMILAILSSPMRKTRTRTTSDYRKMRDHKKYVMYTIRYPDVTAGCKTMLRLDFLPIVEGKCRRNKRKRVTDKFDLEQIKSILSTRALTMRALI